MKMLFGLLYLSLNICNLVFADDFNSISKATNQLNQLNSKVNNLAKIEPNCGNCGNEQGIKSFKLEADSIELEDINFLKSDVPISIRLIQNENTPKKLKISFKNNHKICGKMISYINDYTKALAIECLYYVTEFETQEIELNLSKISNLKVTESNVFELRLSKPDLDKLKFNLNIESLNNQKIKFKKENKFFSDGIVLQGYEDKSE